MTSTETCSRGIAAAESCAETIERWHRLIEWAGGLLPEAFELSREDRRFLVQSTGWRNDPDPMTLREAIEEEAREWPVSVDFRCASWQPDPASREPDEFRIVISTGGPAVAVFGGISCSSCPTNCELKGQDWFTPWETVDCDYDALQWFSELFICGA